MTSLALTVTPDSPWTAIAYFAGMASFAGALCGTIIWTASQTNKDIRRGGWWGALGITCLLLFGALIYISEAANPEGRAETLAAKTPASSQPAPALFARAAATDKSNFSEADRERELLGDRTNSRAWEVVPGRVSIAAARAFDSAPGSPVRVGSGVRTYVVINGKASDCAINECGRRVAAYALTALSTSRDSAERRQLRAALTQLPK